jgi:hypothetical protein
VRAGIGRDGRAVGARRRPPAPAYVTFGRRIAGPRLRQKTTPSGWRRSRCTAAPCSSRPVRSVGRGGPAQAAEPPYQRLTYWWGHCPGRTGSGYVPTRESALRRSGSGGGATVARGHVARV